MSTCLGGALHSSKEVKLVGMVAPYEACSMTASLKDRGVLPNNNYMLHVDKRNDEDLESEPISNSHQHKHTATIN